MDNNVSTPGVSPPVDEPFDAEKLTAQYLALRDRKKLLEKQQREAIRPYNELMDAIAGQLLSHMQSMGVKSFNTQCGSAYQTTKLSATIKDKSEFKDFVINNSLFELVDWRANAPKVFDFIKGNNGAVPPGLNASSFVKVGVRRPNETEED